MDATITTTKIWTVDEIREKVTTDKVWTTRAILALYARQTSSEQLNHMTTDHNNQGFNGVDAPFMSSLANQINRGRSLSQRQVQVAQRMLRKYATQLTRIANHVL